MPKFQYTALDQNGIAKTGVLEAPGKIEALDAIKGMGLYPTEIEEAGKNARTSPAKEKAQKTGSGKGKPKKSTKKGKAGAKVRSKELTIFTRQLATLIDAGLPLLQSLNVLSKQEPNPNLRSTIISLGESVQSGSTFSEALVQYPKVFNKLFVNMVKAGELGGVLEVVLKRLADYQEKAQRLRSKIVAAMVYPTIIMVIAMGILVFLMLVIVPKFKEMFANADTELPWISQFVFSISDWFVGSSIIPAVPNAGVLLLIGVGIYATFLGAKKNPKWLRKIDALSLKIPLVGRVLRLSAVTRFARTFGTLVTSGVPILQALQITRETAGNIIVADAVSRIHDSVKEGESIVMPMTTCPVFPPMMISMVDVGEETGQLPDMLIKVAEVYDEEVDTAVGALTSALEPIMIVFLAVVVGGIVFAMFLPLMEIIKNV